MGRRLLLAALLLLLTLPVAACNQLEPGDTGTGVDLGDPDVGGGAGVETGPETPIPTATATLEASPRLDGTAAAVATFPPASPTLAATAAPPTATTAAPTAEPATASTPEPTPPPSDTAPTPTAGPATELPPSPTAEGGLNEAGEIIHTVQPGENLYRIGLKYGISWVVIAEYNGITNADAIAVGQELRIPPAPTATAEAESAAPPSNEEAANDPPPVAESPVEAQSATAVPASSPAVEGTHTVTTGDTLYDIARRYGVSWAQLAEANGLASLNQIFAGQVLKIPADIPGPTQAFNHQVQRGDTLAAIARQYGLTTDELAQANGLAAPYVIFPGQAITIPGE